MKTRKGKHEVYNILKDKLLSYEFKPGQPLMEIELAKICGVSRIPIREALSKLEGDGLVEIIPRKGAFVRFLSIDEIEDIFEVRRALESLSVRLAVHSIDSEDLKEYETFYKSALVADSAEDPQLYGSRGGNFHVFVARCSRNQLLEKMVYNILCQIGVSLGRPYHEKIIKSGHAHQRYREYLAIIAALKNQDECLADKCMREHLINSEKRIISSRGK